MQFRCAGAQVNPPLPDGAMFVVQSAEATIELPSRCGGDRSK